MLLLLQVCAVCWTYTLPSLALQNICVIMFLSFSVPGILIYLWTGKSGHMSELLPQHHKESRTKICSKKLIVNPPFLMYREWRTFLLKQLCLVPDITLWVMHYHIKNWVIKSVLHSWHHLLFWKKFNLLSCICYKVIGGSLTGDVWILSQMNPFHVLPL